MHKLNKIKQLLEKNFNFKNNKYEYFPQRTQELRTLIRKLINKYGETVDLNIIDTSNIKEFTGLFGNYSGVVYIPQINFRGDVSEWNVSNGISFNHTFNSCSQFNSDLSNWDTSNGETFMGTFSQNKYLNFNVNNWNVSNGKEFSFMFEQTKKQKDIDLSNWDVSMGKKFNAMFLLHKESAFGVAHWNLNRATNISNMFEFCSNFTEDISNWEWNRIKCIKYDGILNGCEKFNFFLLKEFDINPINLTSSWFFHLRKNGKLY